MNKKPGQMYQKCLITYSVAVLFFFFFIAVAYSGFAYNLRFKLSLIAVFLHTQLQYFSVGPEFRI